LNDWSGGILRRRVVNTAVDTARFASSTGTTHFYHQWTLAEATRNLGSASLSNKHVRCGAEFRNQQHVVFDDTLVRVTASESRRSPHPDTACQTRPSGSWTKSTE